MVRRTASVDGVGAGYLLVAALAGLLGGGVSAVQQLGMVPQTGLLAGIEQAHVALMLLFVVVPALVCGFGTLWLPRALKREGTVLPGLNKLSLACVSAAGVLMVASPWQTGATLLWCVGTLLAVMVVLATIFDSRADGAARAPFSPFVWGEMLASSVLLMTVPVLAAVMSHQILNGVAFTPSVLDGFAEPIMLVTLLAGFGIVFETGATVARFSPLPVAGVMSASAAAGSILWVKNVFAHGLVGAATVASLLSAQTLVLSAATLASVLLAALWMAGTWRASMTVKIPMLWGLGFLAVVSTGWISQFMQGDGLHSALQVGTLYAVFCGLYLWRGEGCNRWYPTPLAAVQFGVMAAGTALAIPTLPPVCQMWSGGLLGASVLCFLLTMGLSFTQNRPMAESAEGNEVAFDAAETMVHS